MPLKEVPEGWVSVPYQMGDDPFVFMDAIVMEKIEYDSLTPIQIEIIKQERYQKWLFTIEQMINNPEPPLPFPEENL